MSNFSDLARTFKHRADMLQHIAEHVGPLPLVTEDQDGEPLTTPYNPNDDMRETLKILRALASQLSSLDHLVEFATDSYKVALEAFRDQNADAADDAECGYYDSRAARD